MQLKFSKMHGLGNDFMVLQLLDQQCTLSEPQIRAWADRKTGIGFDQLLLIENTVVPGCDFSYRIFNSDGGEVEHCGNGARCVPRFLKDKGFTTKSAMTFAMARGTIRTRLEDNGEVTVDMGIPILDPASIPFVAEARAITYPLQVGGREYMISAVSMGNPHAVMTVADVDTAAVEELGPLIEHHPHFPQRVNAGFMQVTSPGTIRLRVYERGAGETLACGTGACAAVVAGRLQGLLDAAVVVGTRGGNLHITWEGTAQDPGHSLWMTGPATTVFDGMLNL
jgi:diaminopimelate epimerase